MEGGDEPQGLDPNDPEHLRAERDQALAELAEMKKRHLRAVADAENVRKRLQREMEQMRGSVRDKIVREWLDAVDSVDRALEMDGEDPQVWREGVRGIHRQMLEVLKRQRIAPMESTGARFDPHQHEAVGTIPLPGHEPGSVAHTQRTGYRSEEGEVVRPALVVVVQES